MVKICPRGHDNRVCSRADVTSCLDAVKLTNELDVRVGYADDVQKGCLYYLQKSSKCRIDLRTSRVLVQKLLEIISLILDLVPLSMNRNSQVRLANRV